KFGSGSTSINPGAAGTAANVIGGLTAGAGLLGQLTGATPATGGLIGKLGSLLGNDGFTLDPSLSGTTGAQTAADAASQYAATNTDAGDLAAASNQQYFDSL